MKPRRQSYEERISEDYEKGRLKSMAPSKAELKHFKEAARATLQHLFNWVHGPVVGASGD